MRGMGSGRRIGASVWSATARFVLRRRAGRSPRRRACRCAGSCVSAINSRSGCTPGHTTREQQPEVVRDLRRLAHLPAGPIRDHQGDIFGGVHRRNIGAEHPRERAACADVEVRGEPESAIVGRGDRAPGSITKPAEPSASRRQAASGLDTGRHQTEMEPGGIEPPCVRGFSREPRGFSEARSARRSARRAGSERADRPRPRGHWRPRLHHGREWARCPGCGRPRSTSSGVGRSRSGGQGGDRGGGPGSGPAGLSP